jgi:hypothetical protein
MPMTWEFFDKYWRRGLCRDQPELQRRARTPSGFDLGQLQSDLAQITST